jgi:putative acetyltransferase
MIDVAIRPEHTGDVVAVRRVNERAFGGPAERALVDALRGSDGSLSLVATMAGRVVGQIMFTPVTVDGAADVRVAGLAPVAVLPEHQRAGVGTHLIRAGLAACREQGYAAFMIAVLDAQVLPGLTGIVRYRPEFAATDA